MRPISFVGRTSKSVARQYADPSRTDLEVRPTASARRSRDRCLERTDGWLCHCLAAGVTALPLARHCFRRTSSAAGSRGAKGLRRKQWHVLSGASSPGRRSGTSLTEVLAALLVMSVGILGVMTLFPIAVIRSLQATQLTNATILAKRADALVEMFDLTSDRYIPQPAEGRVTHAIIDPLGWNDLIAVGNTGTTPWLYGHTGGSPPTPAGYLPPGLPHDPALTQQNIRAKWPRFKRPYRTGPGAPPQFLDIRAPLQDPSGSFPGVPLRRLSFGPGLPGRAFGNSSGAGGGPGSPPGPYPPTANIFTSGAPGTDILRDEMLAGVSLPDNFNTIFSGEPDGSSPPTTTSVQFMTDLSFMETSTNPLVPGSRLVLVDVTGKRSQVRDNRTDALVVRPAAAPGEWEIVWSGPLPGNFGTISEVRVEVPQARYTWILTVRKEGKSGGSVANIDCVVFFNRPLGDPEEELLHQAFAPVQDQTTANPPYQLALGPQDTGPRDLLTIWFSANKTEGPPLKKGGWLFDPQNALWYRMLDIVHESDSTNGGNGSATVQLDRRAAAPISWVTVPEGVINVFPLPQRFDRNTSAQVL